MGKTRNYKKLVKAIIFRVIVVFLSIVITLVALEFFFSFLYPFDFSPSYSDVDPRWNQPDPELGFIRKPLLQWEGWAYSDRLAHYVQYRTDENGFRNPPGITSADIVFVGDSFTEAGNVPEQNTFVQLVASRLNMRTVNLGRGYYGPQQELKVIERYAFKYSPKAIVWVIFEGNDIQDAVAYSNFLQQTQKDSSQTWYSYWHWSLKRFQELHLFQILRLAYSNTLKNRNIYELTGTFQTSSGKLEAVEFFHKYNPDILNELPEGWQDTKEAILKGLQLCQERNIQLIIVFIPIKLRVMGPFTTFSSQTILDKYLPGGKWENESDFETLLRHYCDSIGCDFIDAREKLIEKAKSGQLVYSARYDTHLDIEGHSVIADLVLEKFKFIHQDLPKQHFKLAESSK